jgi:hypothetical protein
VGHFGVRRSRDDTAMADNSAFYYAWSDNRNQMKVGVNQQRNEANVRFTKIPPP